jgi:hypothetical protein
MLRLAFAVATIAFRLGQVLQVALEPRDGAPLVAAWLAGIIVNLLTFSGWCDVALQDFGLLLAAVTVARLAVHDDTRLRRRGSSA